MKITNELFEKISMVSDVKASVHRSCDLVMVTDRRIAFVANVRNVNRGLVEISDDNVNGFLNMPKQSEIGAPLSVLKEQDGSIFSYTMIAGDGCHRQVVLSLKNCGDVHAVASIKYVSIVMDLGLEMSACIERPGRQVVIHDENRIVVGMLATIRRT